MKIQTIDEQIELGKHVMATAEVIGVVLSSAAANMIVEDLEVYSFVDCCAALKKCRAEVKTRLTLSDIVTRINQHDGRPTANEAWGLALQSSDEMDTVIWTSEVATAYDAAKAILNAGDKIGARMAFIAAYERVVESARATGAPAQWLASFGWDKELRERALASAVKLQRLTLDQAKAHGYLSAAPITADGRAIAGLLTGSSNRNLLALTSDEKTRAALLTEETAENREASPEVRERLHKLRQDLVASSAEKTKRRQRLFEAQQRDLAQRKQKIQDQVDQLTRGTEA